ncbi:MAG: hypothetical protein FWB86_00395 [Treponema sp.]|nr:hypothetical protein [Treponema sp.]MCL2251320.1 hypothetical protein [Treponema sp.]
MNRLIFKILMLIIILSISACASTITISEELSPAEIIQRGQEALDRNRYNIAIQYYQALHDRNRTNIDLIITAEYHIANIHYKQGKFALAREELNKVLAYYNSPDEELLPQHFKRLSQIVLQRIDEKERKGFGKKKNKEAQE